MLFTVEFQLLSKKFPLPAGQVTLTEEQLDQYTREYLQILANSKELVRFVLYTLGLFGWKKSYSCLLPLFNLIVETSFSRSNYYNDNDSDQNILNKCVCK